MSSKKSKETPPTTPGLSEFDITALTGAIAGAAVGALAGPPGVVAGTVLGASMGMAAGSVMEHEHEREAEEDKRLDDEIGVTKGDLGAASPDLPPARRGTYSAGAAGAGDASPVPSDGPMSSGDA
jgi:phage tail tape-measure protein